MQWQTFVHSFSNEPISYHEVAVHDDEVNVWLPTPIDHLGPVEFGFSSSIGHDRSAELSSTTSHYHIRVHLASPINIVQILGTFDAQQEAPGCCIGWARAARRMHRVHWMRMTGMAMWHHWSRLPMPSEFRWHHFRHHMARHHVARHMASCSGSVASGITISIMALSSCTPAAAGLKPR